MAFGSGKIHDEEVTSLDCPRRVGFWPRGQNPRRHPRTPRVKKGIEGKKKEL